METVLCLDDDQYELESLKRILKKNYNLVCSTDPKAFLELIKNNEPSLIMLDVQMPAMTGYDVCELIKQEEQFKDVPVIFLTGMEDDENIRKAFEVGGADYLSKPFRPTELKARVRFHISHYLATEKVKRLSEEKSHFLQMASHDLKSPLTCINGYAQLLKNELKKEKNQMMIDQVIESSKTMVSLIDDLLNVEKIEAAERRKDFVDHDVSSIVNQAVVAIRNYANRKNIEVEGEIDPLCCINGNPLRMQQVFDNLINNAIKYSPEDSVVNISLKRVEWNGEQLVRFAVQDQGNGIAKDEIGKLFGKFVKLASSRPTAGEDSTGLGLYIVKTLVEAHGGKVWCESDWGEGACFIVEIPAVDRAAGKE